MPPRGVILDGLTAVSNDWWVSAVGWHALLGALLAALARGWRPSRRSFGRMLAAPVLSVGFSGWVGGNPFNGLLFVMLAIGLAWTAGRLGVQSVTVSSAPFSLAGGALVTFGWVYPHFLHTDHWVMYLMAAPLGLVPCPTLSTVIGLTLIFRGLESRRWSGLLSAVGLAYGLIGVFRLGVGIDVVLILGAAALAAASVRRPAKWLTVRATADERARTLPGDEIILRPVGTLTHALTIGQPPDRVWPWLAQMGAGCRAGWYSYDWLDNGGRDSASRIVPEWQDVRVGTLFPALPGLTDGFVVLAISPPRSLTLGWTAPDGRPLVTWSFVLLPSGAEQTRLIVRARGASGYRFRGMPEWVSPYLARVVHLVMERRQLAGIAARAMAHA